MIGDDDDDDEWQDDLFPPSSEPTTSFDAAKSVAEDTNKWRQKIYAFLKARGDRGATEEEIDHLLDMEGNTVRPRCWELRKMGLVELTMEKRPNRSGRLARVNKVIA